MAESRALPKFLQRRPLRHAAVLAVLLAVLEVVVDVRSWSALNVSIVYGLPLVVAGGARSRRLLWSLALVLVASTFTVYAVQSPYPVFSLHEPIFLNRVLGAATILLTASLVHVLIAAMDRLDRQNAELDERRREAEAASGRKSRLLASVSHDMSTPLTAISLVAELIRRKAADPDAAGMPELARELQANAAALAGLVSDVLDIASIESGRIELRESEFSLNELIAEECGALQPLAAAKSLRLAIEPSPEIALSADRVKLARVLRNLISNAIKFTKAGTVTVSWAPALTGRWLEVRIADTGVGMAAADLEHIFDDFSQIDAGGGGWGLGLAVSRRLAELMGGGISVESVPGGGSVFTVRLPARLSGA